MGNGVKGYPFKVIEPGSSVKSSLISEGRGMATLFGRHGVRGLVNVDVTPETVVRLAMSYGTMLSKDAVVSISRDAHPASRVLSRAAIAGLNATGIAVVVDYAHSGASALVARVLDRLDIEAVTVNSPSPLEVVKGEDHEGEAVDDRRVERVRHVVEAMEADLGVVVGASGESLVIIDEGGNRVPDETMLLLLIEQAGRRNDHGAVALPLHITRQAEAVGARSGLSIVRTSISEASLMAEAARPDVVFAATLGGKYIYPALMPSPDAILSFGKILELLASDPRPLAALAAAMPSVYVQHAVLPCPWHVKGAVMRRMIEDLKQERLSLIDGIKISVGEEDWVQIVPDADDPVFHVFAEASSDDAARGLLGSYRLRLMAVVAERESEEG